MDRLVDDGRKAGDSVFVQQICQITFNVWHYSGDHLWAGIIENLVAELSARFAEGPVEAGDPESTAARVERRTGLRQILQSALLLLSSDPAEAARLLRAARAVPKSPVRTTLPGPPPTISESFRLLVSLQIQTTHQSHDTAAITESHRDINH